MGVYYRSINNKARDGKLFFFQRSEWEVISLIIPIYRDNNNKILASWCFGGAVVRALAFHALHEKQRILRYSHVYTGVNKTHIATVF